MNTWEWIYYVVIFIAVALTIMASGYTASKTVNAWPGLLLSWFLFSGVIVLIFLADFYNWFSVEGFTFRVSPWKQACLSKGGPCCCKKGFIGQKRNIHKNFEYTGDHGRLCGGGCSEYKDEPDCSCEAGKDVVEGYEHIEPYCPSCEYQGHGCAKCSEACDYPKRVIKLMTDTPETVPVEEGVKEGYCTKCEGVTSSNVYSPKPDLVEGYCGSCSGNAY